MRFLSGLAAAAAAPLLVIASETVEADIPDPTIVTEQNQDEIIHLHVGQRVIVNLSENATTGYRWEIEQIDRNLIEISEPEPQYSSRAIGSSGRIQWTLLAKAPGSTSVILKQWRPWEGESSVVGRFRIQLHIAP